MAVNKKQASQLNAAKPAAPAHNGTIALVGSPNVGKSVIFNALTGTYVTVSNYPGTTVEVSHGRWKAADGEYRVVDTPGMYSLLPITEEERVARSLLLTGEPQAVVHVVDAKNLERMLPLTLQLLEAGLPLVLDVNVIDEADKLGISIDLEKLEETLGIPVAATAGISGRGVDDLSANIQAVVREKGRKNPGHAVPVSYGSEIEESLEHISSLLGGDYLISKRAVGLLLLQEDDEVCELARTEEGHRWNAIVQEIDKIRKSLPHSPNYTINLKRKEVAHRMASECVDVPEGSGVSFGEKLSRILIRPVTGIPVLIVVLFVGLYLFVGVFGAGILVDFIEGYLFEGLLNPLVNRFFDNVVPWAWLRDLFAGEFGIITLGLRYGVAIILPIVGTFFLAFSVLEDSGYFPRLAMLVDRLFKKIGLSGRAVIPMVLGFGCDTMATIVTRTLETKRERIIATLLLALAIPCSAQLGVILGILSAFPVGLFIWAGVILVVFLLVGLLAAKLMPGEQPSFYMELPPLRLPKLSNVIVKTLSRMQWYFIEILPFFLLASVFIWLGRITGFFPLLIRGLKPVMGWLGLPDETAIVFIFGFFRRDYGAAGLFDLWQAGGISGNQLVVAAVTLTLFIPCVAQFAIMWKERGWKTTVGMTLFIFPFAFFVGFLVHRVLSLTGVVL